MGEVGLTLLVSENGEALFGEGTKTWYRFDVRKTLYVDDRDVVYLLHPGVNLG